MPSTRRGGRRDLSTSATRTSRSGAIQPHQQLTSTPTTEPSSKIPKVAKQGTQPPATGTLTSTSRASRSVRPTISRTKPAPKLLAKREEDDESEEENFLERKDGKICVSNLITASDIASMPTLTVSALSKQQQQSRQRRPSHTSSSTTTNGTVANGARRAELEKENSKERNIDQVIFGDVAFKAWYPSYYPSAVLGSGDAKSRGDGKGDGIEVGKGIVVERLYVCGTCFAYSREVVEWWRHVKCCEPQRDREGRRVPGKKIYMHGSGAEGAAAGQAGDSLWSIWEVDGEVDTLFCQNLSLFAKLFLDNKSVFFDVQSFNYFLLVHTSPLPPHTPQIVGFFSKEKMSWDNNNLACILIFPPWQRKGLGALLMGVSYEISRREGILGGPEKPISELGRKGYKRFWGGELARWLLDVKETDRKKGKGMVDVEKISKETWILGEDCLTVLREMGVVEPAGRGKGTVERVKIDKEKVREWVLKNKISLETTVDKNGFVEGYGIKALGDETPGD